VPGVAVYVRLLAFDLDVTRWNATGGVSRDLDCERRSISSATDCISSCETRERDTDVDEEMLRDKEELSIASAREAIWSRELLDREIDTDVL
jgi:hypothetical protein